MTVPKFIEAGLAAIAPGATPVPDTAIEVVGVGAFEVTVTLPLALPVAVGANLTVKLADLPAFSVTGRVKPVTLNPLPLAPRAETVTADPPEFVMVSERLCVVPVVTLPKLSEDGLAAMAPAVTPVPETEMLAACFEASVATLMLPV
jgi:hypothetical protein